MWGSGGDGDLRVAIGLGGREARIPLLEIRSEGAVQRPGVGLQHQVCAGFDQRICCRFAKRLPTTVFTVDSAKAVDPRSPYPAGQRDPHPGLDPLQAVPTIGVPRRQAPPRRTHQRRRSVSRPRALVSAPRSYSLGTMSERLPGFHLGKVESAPSHHDKIDLKGFGPVREQQVANHRRVGEFQQERQMEGPLAD